MGFEADTGAFERAGKHDRHQFRIILSAEDGAELSDLRAFTRAPLKQVEQDLGIQLKWVAVDHWDTAHPHTHIVVRGKNDRGRDLVIARDYMGYGMRARASELATALRWSDEEPWQDRLLASYPAHNTQAQRLLERWEFQPISERERCQRIPGVLPVNVIVERARSALSSFHSR